MKPRPYQRDAMRRTMAYAAENPTGRLLLVIPPRGGKTMVGAWLVLAMAVRHGLPALWLAHREELLDQAVEHLVEVGIPRSMIGVIKAGRSSDPDAKIQVASEATLARRDLPPAAMVVTDESHRDTAPRRRRLRACYPHAFLLGLTGTPKPPPQRDLGEDYDSLMVVVQPSELIHDGYLAVPTIFAPARDAVPDLRGVRTSDGDYRPADLEPLLTKPGLIDEQIAEWARLSEERVTLAFAATVVHSKALVERFRAHGVKAVHLDGQTPRGHGSITSGEPVDRKGILEGLAAGRIPVVSTVAVLSEGTSIPRVKCVLGVRPTCSLTFYVQSMMRCATPWNDVPPRVLDVAGNVYTHHMPHADRTWSLRNAESGRVIGERPIRRCDHCGAINIVSASVCLSCGKAFPAPVVRAPVMPDVPLHLQAVEPSKAQVNEERCKLVAYATEKSFADPEAWADRVLAAKGVA